MRVFDMLAIAAVLCAGVSAEKKLSFSSTPTPTANPENYRIRSENNGNKGDSRSQKYYTEVFNMAPDSYGPEEEFEGMYLLGMIIGFIVTGFFMIFGFIVIVRDEVLRHKKFEEDLEKEKKKLTSDTYGVSSGMMATFAAEFRDKEAARGKAVDAEAERKALQEIN